ncbi:MAG: carboxylesterase family protein [Hyphomonadaceae bacterium]|nr:carboxylesterase family protein [Hyphomonadaceae bacterium]
MRGVSGAGFDVFRGIPYASAPVGELRWRPPAPAAAWDGIRDATSAGRACPQPLTPRWGDVGPTSEDCLYLDVWRPAGSGAGAALPVMVWIHGGGFIIGSGSLPLYDASALVRRNVIVVSINYRLGRLGFLAHPALSAEQRGASGNYGLMDQIAALRWVRRNISAFGGDPSNVTVVGESAGGLSILALMTSPMGVGLFDKAIVQSGLGLASLSRLRDGAFPAESLGAAWTASRGISDATPQALRALTVDQVLEGQTYAGPVIDGVVVVRSPGDAFRRGEQSRIPLIIGSNSFEASLTELLSEGLTRATIGSDTYEALLARYAEREPVDSARQTLIGEVFGGQPSRFIATEHARAGAPAFLYYFDQVRISQRGRTHGAPHGGELPYLFATPQQFFTEWPAAALSEWDESDRRVSEAMIGYWTTFARTGNPNLADAPRWDAVRVADAEALLLGERIEMKRFDALADDTESAAVAASVRQWQ